jgi:hypothetical protein
LPIFYEPFFKENFSLFQPSRGLIKVRKGEKIIFKLKNQNKKNRLAYSFNTDKTATKINHDSEFIEFEVPVRDTRPTILTIFSNEKSILTYKVEY